MSENSNSKFDINNYEELAKAAIRKRADESRKKGYTLYNMEDVEAALKKQEDERALARERLYRERAKRHGEESPAPFRHHKENSEITVYKAKAALNAQAVKKKPARPESFLHRTFRLIKGISAAKKEIRRQPFMTEEKRKKMILDVYKDAWQPVTDFFGDMVEDLWDFLCEVWDDFEDIILFIVDIFIAIGYYFGSFCLFVWDIIWDLRIWFEEHKKAVFQWFSAAIGVVVVSLIAISSFSGYEYSYYGRVLGITRSKQEVYQTIEALGDKLSEASGANINFDVERDIEFKRVRGFNLEIDSSDDILNTLTYMKDIQVRAYAVALDGQTAVILENEETANKVIQNIRDAYAGPRENTEYTQISSDQTITVEEVGVQLGDIWRPQDAVSYLLYGYTDYDPDESGVEINPKITMRTTEIATYYDQIKFGAKYIDNSEIYADETELITAGIYGKNEVVAEITRINGEEVGRTIKSTKRISNPVDAVYYQGTKPIPEKKGTGTFIYPVKKYTISSRFGSRNTGIKGASTYHQGVDFAAPTGTKIYASDGGKVTFAGWQSGYGYMVEIDHGGLYSTRYGHCSKLLVKVGDAIYQGQNIALVGSTGVSSGPHCHFEIRYKDVAHDPLPYLRGEM